MKKFFCDIEMTGTDYSKHGIVQIAGIIVIDGVEKERFNFSIQPFSSDVIDQEALTVNGVAAESLFAAPRLTPHQAYHELITVLSRYVDKFNKRDKFFFIGYNARFDVDFLRAFFEKCLDKYFGSWFWFPPIDVMNMAALDLINVRPKLENFKLGTVAVVFDLKADGDLHDAFTDIKLTMDMFNLLEGKKYADIS